MLEFRSVAYAYPSDAAPAPALQDVSVVLHPGEMVALLGGNGSGKSTLARLSNGLLLPETGEVVVDGLSTSDSDVIWDVRSRVGLVLQNPDNQIVGTIVEEDVAFGPENLCREPDVIRRDVDAALAAVGLTGFERREPHALSGGQKQRVAIAGALALRPAYIVLDEPTSMLDSESARDVLRVLRALADSGVGVMLITHDVVEALSCDRTVVLRGGTVGFEGTAEEFASSPDALSAASMEAPGLLKLVAELRSSGLNVPARSIEAERVVEALCR